MADSKKYIELLWHQKYDKCEKGDTFHNQWQSFRVKKSPKVDYEARHKYDVAGQYQIMAKVVDVFGNDTNKVIKVEV
jgi:adenine-specific DNA-methyltransferase